MFKRISVLLFGAVIFVGLQSQVFAQYDMSDENTMVEEPMYEDDVQLADDQDAMYEEDAMYSEDDIMSSNYVEGPVVDISEVSITVVDSFSEDQEQISASIDEQTALENFDSIDEIMIDDIVELSYRVTAQGNLAVNIYKMPQDDGLDGLGDFQEMTDEQEE